MKDFIKPNDMKRIAIAVLAVAAIASCTKNYVNPLESDTLEITFQTVVCPQTKALEPGQVEYAGDAFHSTAFYLDNTKNWAANSEDAVVYLRDKIIGSGNPKKWAAATPYYWPKGGKLTFMSYALLDQTNQYVDATSFVTADKTGLTVSAFNVNTYKDHDLLVAAIASDKTANENVYLTNGVPTLFGHKLCKLAINAQTDAAYSTKTFNIKSITINNLQSVGTYTMDEKGLESWGSYGTPAEVTFFTGSAEINNDDDDSTKTPITAAQSVYLPQDFQDTETITIVYTITTGSFVENVSVTKKLSEVFTSGEWEMNKVYNLDLKFGLETILWDPAQTDWEDGSDGSISL